MYRGTVKWFNNAKGFGFIVSPDFNEDLFVHYSSIVSEGYKSLKTGQEVQFEAAPKTEGVHAVNITPLAAS